MFRPRLFHHFQKTWSSKILRSSSNNIFQKWFGNCSCIFWSNLASPEINNIGLWSHGHVHQSENHERDGCSSFPKMKPESYRTKMKQNNSTKLWVILLHNIFTIRMPEKYQKCLNTFPMMFLWLSYDFPAHVMVCIMVWRDVKGFGRACGLVRTELGPNWLHKTPERKWEHLFTIPCADFL